MPYKSEHILTQEEVNWILQTAWELGNPMLQNKAISSFKIKDFEVLEHQLQDYFDGLSQFSVGIPSAGALLNLLQKGDTKRNKAVAVVSFYVLLKLNVLGDVEKYKLSKVFFGKDVFSEYTNRAKVLTKVKAFINGGPAASEDPIQEASPSKFKWIAIFTILVLLISFTALKMWPRLKPAEINWEIAKTHYASSTETIIIVNYDLSNLKYKVAKINFGDGTIVPLEKKQGSIKHTYFSHTTKGVKLIIDGKEYEKPIPFARTGWIASVDHEFLHDSSFFYNGALHLKKNKETEKIWSDEYYVVYTNTRDYEVDLDDMIFETRIKNPESEGGISCFDVSLDLSGRNDNNPTAISFNLLNPHCTSWAKLRVSEVKLHYGNYDLRGLGQNLEDWRVVKAVVKDMEMKLYLDNELFYTIPYEEKLGKLRQIQILFKGNGSADYVRISNNKGKVLFNDDFDRKPIN